MADYKPGRSQENQQPATSKAAWRRPWGLSPAKERLPSPKPKAAKEPTAARSRLSRFSHGGQPVSTKVVRAEQSLSPSRVQQSDTPSNTPKQRANPLSRMWTNLKSSAKPKNGRQDALEFTNRGGDDQDTTATKLRFSPQANTKASRRHSQLSDDLWQEKSRHTRATRIPSPPKAGLLSVLAAGAAQAVQRKKSEQATREAQFTHLPQAQPPADVPESDVIVSGTRLPQAQPPADIPESDIFVSSTRLPRAQPPAKVAGSSTTVSNSRGTLEGSPHPAAVSQGALLQEAETQHGFSTPTGAQKGKRGGRHGREEAAAEAAVAATPALSYVDDPMDIDSPFLNQTPQQEVAMHLDSSEGDQRDEVDAQEALFRNLEAEQEAMDSWVSAGKQHDQVDLQEARFEALEAEQEIGDTAGNKAYGRQDITMNLEICLAGNPVPMVSAGSSVPGAHRANVLLSAGSSAAVAQELAAQQQENSVPGLAEEATLPLSSCHTEVEEENDENVDPSALPEAPQASKFATPASFQRLQDEKASGGAGELDSPQLSIPDTPSTEEPKSDLPEVTPGVIFCATNSIFSPLPGEQSLGSHHGSLQLPATGGPEDLAGVLATQTQQSFRSLHASLGGLSKVDHTTPSLEDKFNLLHYLPTAPSARLSFGMTPFLVTKPSSSSLAGNQRRGSFSGRPSLSGSQINHHNAQDAAEQISTADSTTPSNQPAADGQDRSKSAATGLCIVSEAEPSAAHGATANPCSSALASLRNNPLASLELHATAVPGTEHDTSAPQPERLSAFTRATDANVLEAASLVIGVGEPSPLAGHRRTSTSPRRSSLGPLDPSWAEEYKKLLAVEAVGAAGEPEQEDSWLTPSQDSAAGSCGDLLTERVATAVGTAAKAAHIPGPQAKALLKALYPALESMLLEAFEADRTRREVLEITTSSLQESLRSERLARSEAQSTADARILQLESELAQVRSEYAEQEKQFKVLHRDKYVPLKEAAAVTSEQLEEERTRRRALQQEVQSLSQDVQQVRLENITLQRQAQARREDAIALQGELDEAHAQLSRAETRHSEDAEEITELEEQLDECQGRVKKLEEMHRAEISRKDAELRESQKLVSQAERDRRDASATADYYSAQVDSLRAKSSARSAQPSPEAASLEISWQKEEIYELKSGLHALKAENGKYADVKAQLEGQIAELQDKFAKQTEEHNQLLTLCDELLKMQEAEQGLK